MRRAFLLLLVAVVAASCNRTVDITTALKVTDVRTGWSDIGPVNGGQNKLVPSISLKLENVSGDLVAGVQLNAIFHRVDESENWGEHWVRAVDQEGLKPGSTTNAVVLRSTLGYTGDQPKPVMLQHKEFVDARVEVFGKQGRNNWVKLTEVRIARQLLGAE